MALFLYRQFLVDLRTEGDAKFARRVLSKVLDSQGHFPSDSEDHRYEGIVDAWIRYVSMGGAAIRVVYIRKGQDVFLYRAGPHSVEDNLPKPKAGAEVVAVLTPSLDLAAQYEAAGGSLVAPQLGLLPEAKKKGFFPFDESAVEAIVSQLRQITPRKIINTMQQVLEEVRLAGLDPDKSKVDISFLDHHNIVEEVLGEGGVT